MHVLVEVVERRVRQPGFIEVQRIDAIAEHFLQHFHVVEHAVVGRLRDREDARLGFLVGDERIGVDFFLDARGAEFSQRNRPDNAQVIARRHQEYRIGPGHDDGVQNRNVAIAIHHHRVARCHIGVPDHLVRGRGAVGDEETVIGIENTRGVSFGGRDRTSVIEQLAQLIDGIADVGT